MSWVSREEFDAGLARLAALPGDPQAGFFGPGSMMWKVGREATGFFGSGAAILLQTAHPWVAQAIADHSIALTNPVLRFHRTFRPVFAMIYGTRDQALAQARAIRAVHERIHGRLPEAVGRFAQGSAYMANDGHALFWVYATLIHITVAVRERLAPLDPAEKDRHYDETRIFAALFGVPQALLPSSWAAFEARFDEIAASDTLAVGGAGRMIADYFLAPGKGHIGPMVPGWYRDITASLLPPPLAQAFGLSETQGADKLWRLLAVLHRALPLPVRHIGPYQEACRRLAGRPAGPWVRTLNRAWIGRPLLEPAA